MPPLAMLPAAVAVASALVGWAVGRQGRQQTDAADTRSLRRDSDDVSASGGATARSHADDNFNVVAQLAEGKHHVSACKMTSCMHVNDQVPCKRRRSNLNIGLQQSVLIECISELSSSSIIDGRLWHSLRC